MEYCFLRGFLVILLLQHFTSEGQSASIQSSTVVTLQDGQALPQEPELSPSEVVPVVAPPSLKEVQQAVQEASEQVEGRGAEEVLKELLERVVEAALGQVEGGGEVKVDEAAEQEMVEDDALGDEKGETESDTEAEVLQQAVEEEEEVEEGEDVAVKGGDTGVEEEQEVAEVDALKDVAEEEKGGVGVGETAAGSVEETTAGVETGKAEEVEVIDESLDTKVSHDVVEETVAVLEETDGHFALEEAGVEDNKEQVELSEEKGADETDKQHIEETPAVVKVAVSAESEQEAVVESDPGLVVADVEQGGNVEGKEEALEVETQINEMESEVIVPPSDNHKIETAQTVVRQPAEEEVNIVVDTGGPKVEDEHLVVDGGDAEEEETQDAEMGEAEGGERHGESVIKEESLVNEGLGDQQAGEEEQITLETSHVSEKEDREVLVISAPEPDDGADASIEQSLENKVSTTSPSLGQVEIEENTLGEKSNHGNEIITPADDLLPHDHVVVQPTLDNFVKDAFAEPPQAAGEEPGETNELVEDIAGTKETSELSLEAWKIGAISAAAFLVLETAVIIIYILKCHNRNSTLAPQQACEEGCVEPEAATGGDCSDDTLPAGNGDTQQIAALDSSDVASTLAQNKEQHEEEHAIAMSDLPPRSTEELANTGPGPDSSQDLRTSIL